MANERTRVARSTSTDTAGYARLVLASFVLGTIGFLLGGAIVTVTAGDPPPSTAPLLGITSHVLWFVAIAFLTLGSALLLRRWNALQRGIAGYLALGLLGLGVLHALQWVTWAYVDLRAAGHEQYELALETVITPFGAGLLLAYAILLGSAIACLGWAVGRTGTSRPSVGWLGVALGVVTTVTAGASLIGALEGGGDGHWLFNVATVLLPLCYLWTVGLGIDLVR